MKTRFLIIFVIGIIGFSEVLFTEVLSEPIIVGESRLSDAFENLRESYKSNVTFDNYNLQDVVVGYGISSEQLMVTIDERFSHESELDIIKNNIREIVGVEIPIRFTVSEQITDEDVCGKGNVLVDGICLTPEPPQDYSDIVSGSECGLGTTYQDGICVVNQTENANSNSPYGWGDAYNAPPVAFDEPSHLIPNPNPDARIHGAVVLGAVLFGVVGCFVVLFVIWRKRK